jgi:hypothetical protein
MRAKVTIFLIFLGINSVFSVPIVAEIFQSWVKNFETIEKLSSFTKSLKNVSLVCEVSRQKKIFQKSDFDDYSFSGLLDESGIRSFHLETLKY